MFFTQDRNTHTEFFRALQLEFGAFQIIHKASGLSLSSQQSWNWGKIGSGTHVDVALDSANFLWLFEPSSQNEGFHIKNARSELYLFKNNELLRQRALTPNTEGEWRIQYLSNSEPRDRDKDGFSDRTETELNSDPNDPESRPLDSDGDGIFDFFDLDDDNDNVSDDQERRDGTYRLLKDSDGDGILDDSDEEPLLPHGLPDSLTTQASTPVDGEQPNILFIMADDLNRFIGCMNPEVPVHTPNLDALAQNSTVFTNAHSNAPFCGPSRASLFTGVLPDVSGCFIKGEWYDNNMLANTKTIMEHLSDHGYHSAGVGKLLHRQYPDAWDEVGPKGDYSPFAYDGEQWSQHPGIPALYSEVAGALDGIFTRLSNAPNVLASDRAPGFEGWYTQSGDKSYHYHNDHHRDQLPDEISTQWATRKLEEWNQNELSKPFFMGVGLIRPHTPLVAPDRFFDLFPLDTLTLPDFVNGDDLDTFFEDIHMGGSKGRRYYEALVQSYPSEQEALKRYYQAYLACVAFMDERVGELLDALRDNGFSHNTVVVFTSDHGYTLGEKRNLHKYNLWESSTQVPLIIHDPRHQKGQVIHQPVSLVDLYPTFTQIADAKADNRKSPAGHLPNGRSPLPLVWGTEGHGERFAISKATGLLPIGSNGKRDGYNLAANSIRSRDWRYILYASGKEELYSTHSDGRLHARNLDNLAFDPRYEPLKLHLRQTLLKRLDEAKR